MWRKIFYGGKIGLGVVFFIMICQSVSADVVNIYPSEDSWIASGEQSTTPHGSDTYLWVANPPHYTAYGLIKFDVSSIPEGSMIQSVCLRVFCYHNKYETVDYLNIYQVTSAWDESKVTWRDSPEFDPIPLAMVEVKDSLQGKWVDWRSEKLTDVVKKWLEDRQSNQGLLICALTESYNTYGFVSKEATSSKPVLEVEFTPPRADIFINVETPDGEKVTPEVSILYKFDGYWQEIERKNPESYSYVFKDQIAGKYNVDVYAYDMFLGETGPFNLRGKDIHKSIVTCFKRVLKVSVYHADGKTPVQGALVEIYSWNGERKSYTYREGKYTDSLGEVSFNLWPTQLASKGEHYLLRVIYKNEVIGELSQLLVDREKDATLRIRTTLSSSDY